LWRICKFSFAFFQTLPQQFANYLDMLDRIGRDPVIFQTSRTAMAFDFIPWA